MFTEKSSARSWREESLSRVTKSLEHWLADPARRSAQSKNPRDRRREVVSIYRPFDFLPGGYSWTIKNKWDLDLLHCWVPVALAFAAMIGGHDHKGLLADASFLQSGE